MSPTVLTTVVVVDDERAVANTIAEILRRNGYMAVAAYDGETALHTARFVKPELIVSDVGLPGIDGMQLAMKASEILPRCKVLLFSGHPDTAGLLREAALKGYRFPFLSKPLQPQALLKTLQTMRATASPTS